MQSEKKIDHAVFPPFDSTTYPSQIVWLSIVFALFYLFLKKVILPRISDILEARSQKIDQDLSHAARLKEEADTIILAYDTELAKARVKVREATLLASEQAKAEAEAERKKTIAELGQKLAEAEIQIRQEKLKAKSNIESTVEEVAHLIIKKFKSEKDPIHTLMKAIKFPGK